MFAISTVGIHKRIAEIAPAAAKGACLGFLRLLCIHKTDSRVSGCFGPWQYRFRYIDTQCGSATGHCACSCGLRCGMLCTMCPLTFDATYAETASNWHPLPLAWVRKSSTIRPAAYGVFAHLLVWQARLVLFPTAHQGFHLLAQNQQLNTCIHTAGLAADPFTPPRTLAVDSYTSFMITVFLQSLTLKDTVVGIDKWVAEIAPT